MKENKHTFLFRLKRERLQNEIDRLQKIIEQLNSVIAAAEIRITDCRNRMDQVNTCIRHQIEAIHTSAALGRTAEAHDHYELARQLEEQLKQEKEQYRKYQEHLAYYLETRQCLLRKQKDLIDPNC